MFVGRRMGTTGPRVSHYSSWTRQGVSAEALRRENEAKDIFLKAKRAFEQGRSQPPPQENTPSSSATGTKSKTSFQLLSPKTHLTPSTWKSFKQWVQINHPGWSVKRREAIRKEDLRSCPSRGKGYFVDAIFQDPSTLKSLSSSAAKKAPKRKAVDECDDDCKPAAKRACTIPITTSHAGVGTTTRFFCFEGPPPIYRLEPMVFDNGESRFHALPDGVQNEILTYMDISTLGSLACVNRDFHERVKHDSLWEHHLKFLLETLFDGGIENDPTPISQRDNWRKSSEFRRWVYDDERNSRNKREDGSLNMTCCTLTLAGSTLWAVQDYQSHPEEYAITSPGSEEHFRWLLQDVPLRDYYKHAGALAVEGVNHFYHMCRVNMLCPGCMQNLFYVEQGSCHCHQQGLSPHLVGRTDEGGLELMPRIALFEGVDRSLANPFVVHATGYLSMMINHVRMANGLPPNLIFF